MAGPNVNLSASRSRISDKAGHDSVDLTFNSDMAFTSFDVRVVPSAAALITAGASVLSGALAGSPATDYVETVTYAELIVAGAAEGDNTVKAFVVAPIHVDTVIDAADFIVAGGIT